MWGSCPYRPAEMSMRTCIHTCTHIHTHMCPADSLHAPLSLLTAFPDPLQGNLWGKLQEPPCVRASIDLLDATSIPKAVPHIFLDITSVPQELQARV